MYVRNLRYRGFDSSADVRLYYSLSSEVQVLVQARA